MLYCLSGIDVVYSKQYSTLWAMNRVFFYFIHYSNSAVISESQCIYQTQRNENTKTRIWFSYCLESLYYCIWISSLLKVIMAVIFLADLPLLIKCVHVYLVNKLITFKYLELIYEEKFISRKISSLTLWIIHCLF